MAAAVVAVALAAGAVPVVRAIPEQALAAVVVVTAAMVVPVVKDWPSTAMEPAALEPAVVVAATAAMVVPVQMAIALMAAVALVFWQMEATQATRVQGAVAVSFLTGPIKLGEMVVYSLCTLRRTNNGKV